MPPTTNGQFATLRDLVLHHAGLRGWSTQRHIAVACGLDETALSRFLDGRQDIGAVRTFALFREIGVPVEAYPLAFELLALSQRLARELDGARRTLSEKRAAVLVEGEPEVPGAPVPPPVAAYALRPEIGREPSGAARFPTPATERADQDTPLLTPTLAFSVRAVLSAGDAARLFAAEGFSGEAIVAFFEGAIE